MPNSVTELRNPYSNDMVDILVSQLPKIIAGPLNKIGYLNP